jgi:deoxycytidine triphosphate deaminase
MILAKASINNLIKNKTIRIYPKPELKDVSIKLHFSKKIILKPREFALDCTLETVKLSKGICGLYDGYSKLSQRGIVTHLGSMLVDPDTNGQLTLEIFNFTDREITIQKGERCGQLILMESV